MFFVKKAEIRRFLHRTGKCNLQRQQNWQKFILVYESLEWPGCFKGPAGYVKTSLTYRCDFIVLKRPSCQGQPQPYVVGMTRTKCSDLFQKISNFFVHPELQDTRQPY
jgi:hypothetical protein